MRSRFKTWLKILGVLLGVGIVGTSAFYYSQHPYLPRFEPTQMAMYQDQLVEPEAQSLLQEHQIKRVQQRTQQVTKNEAIRLTPAGKEISDTGFLMRNKVQGTNQVQVRAQTKNHGQKMDEIAQAGLALGWVPASTVKPVQNYMLPYVYTSQFWPTHADDACEIAALKMAMSTQSKALDVSLHEMVSQIPRTNNPNTGYTHDPYQYATHATINPGPMVKVARKYGAHAKNISHAHVGQFINAVQHGQAVVFEGPYMMEKPGSDHDLTILGYKHGQFFVADPFARYRISQRTTWVSCKRLMHLYNASFRHQHAILIY